MLQLVKHSFSKQLPLLAGQASQIHSSASLNEAGSSILDKVFGTRVEKATQAHSIQLPDKKQQTLYELQIHNVRPDATEDYENLYNENIPNLITNNEGLRLTGSWRTEIGNLDQYVHLWQYKNYSAFSDTFNQLQVNPDYKAFNKKIAKTIKTRENQICLSFAFWPDIDPREQEHIYEMRSYSLKPGTLIEWGNNWSRGIRNRLDYRVAGMFTQVGPLYYVHHIWAYKDLADRKASREKMWNQPGWDECVAYTVPLIRKMESKMMTALPFSTNK